MAEAKAGVEKVMVGRATALALRIAAQNDPNLWPLIRAMPKRRHATARGILEMIAAQADVGARKDEMKT